MPYGRFLSPPTDPERTIGRIGRIHGDNIVTIPAKKEKANKSIMQTNNSTFFSEIQIEFLKIKHVLICLALWEKLPLDT